ncbi:MAG TPA: conjugative transfer signal peptidase TraF [Thermoanaerobaculia bacterium]|nr:conjugative transfer signal peptidase TraF [Thermoanaerobaculia bacterium]
MNLFSSLASDLALGPRRRSPPARRPRPRLRSLSIALSPLALVAALQLAGLRFNTSASLPRGVYLLCHRPPARLDLVLACPPSWAARLALDRHYLPAGECPGGTQPLGKILLGLPGDLLDLSATGLSVNGSPIPRSVPLPTDTFGRPLRHHPYGHFLLARDQIWLFSPHPRSFDSRYFGPVRQTAIRGPLAPILTSEP